MLKGKIGKYPVVMALNSDADGGATYFYESSLQDILLNGMGSGKRCLLFKLAGGVGDTEETFRLQQGADKIWTGTCRNAKGVSLPVMLAPVALNGQRSDAVYKAEQIVHLC